MGRTGRTALVVATLPRRPQLPAQIPGRQDLGHCAQAPGAYLDAVVNQIVERALTNAVAADDQNLNAQRAQPPGK